MKYYIYYIIGLFVFTISGNLYGQDSLIVAPTDSIPTGSIDSIAAPPSDSTSIAATDSLRNTSTDSTKVYTPKEIKKMQRDSLKAVRDSIKMVKDSIRLATPRILETYAIPDSLHYKRIIVFNSDNHFNKLTQRGLDTTFNDWNTEYPFFKEDINGTYLGTIGSATQYFNFFKRKEHDIFPYISPYLPYTNTPEDIPLYNTKSPYTELAYWGTLFAYKDKEEMNIKFLHTQNVTPALNLSILCKLFGAKGMLVNEETSNNTFAVTGNHLGKRYIANFGYIGSKIKRNENGGIQNSDDILTDVIDAKTISVNLQSASNRLRKHTVFLNHSYSVPIRLTKKQDSLKLGEGTMAIFGHIGEFNNYSKLYKDQISTSDKIAQEFYNNQFFINPTTSADSMRIMEIENKLFFRLQPWKSDAILSKVDGGIGHQYLNIYNFRPDNFLSPNKNTNQNNIYVYAGVSGQFRKYFSWDAFGKYSFIGYYQNDMDIKANATISFYPFKQKNKGVHLTAKFQTTLTRPDWYSNHYYSNHYIHNNDFSKISKTNIQGKLDIPSWKLSAFFGYSLIANNIYYDTLGIIKQFDKPISVMSASLEKNFKFWYIHLDNQALFQISSHQNVLPLPMLALRLRYYFEFPVVKNVMTVQLGADATFTTAYNAPAYNPALGVFQIQDKEKIGNCPYIDVFANFQWKRASIFVKFTNAAQGWPSADYFSAYHYIKPQRTFKFGVHWPFYIK